MSEDQNGTPISKNNIQKEVRMHDRFICPNCRKRRGEQYAHIVPESDGGLYLPSNLLFLCAECHNNLEPARAKPEQKKRLIELAKRLKNTAREDGLLTSNFTLTADTYPTIRLGGGMTIINSVSVLEKQDEAENPYLKLESDEMGRLLINAKFEDASGSVVMEIINNTVHLHTKNAWDIVITRRSIVFEDANQKINLNISQAEDLSLLITGNLYLNGGLYTIDSKQISSSTGMVIRDTSSEFNGYGVLLSPDRLVF